MGGPINHNTESRACGCMGGKKKECGQLDHTQKGFKKQESQRITLPFQQQSSKIPITIKARISPITNFPSLSLLGQFAANNDFDRMFFCRFFAKLEQRTIVAFKDNSAAGIVSATFDKITLLVSNHL